MENTDKLAVLIDADNAQPSGRQELEGQEYEYMVLVSKRPAIF